MRQILATLPVNPSVSGSSPWRIPVWFVHLRDSDGTSNHTDFEIEPALDEVNQYFNGLFEFTLCNSVVINDDQFSMLDLSASSSDVSDLHNNVNSLYQPAIGHCVKIFLCDGTSTGGSYAHPRLMYEENGAVYIADGLSRTIAHELGHYFGLPHTFANAPNQYVHDIDHPVVIYGESYTCDQTGDGFCDTPADLETCEISDTDCSAPPDCDPINDPLGTPYDPDPTLLMGYHDNCVYRFSPQQNTQMSTLYNLHPAYFPLKEVPSQCRIHTGRILSECLNISQFPLPLAGLPVILRHTSQTNPCLDETSSTGRYEINPCNWIDDKRSIMPELVNYSSPLNGVTTFDLVLISKHILGIQPLDGPFKMIAADANNSGTLTTSDVVAIRKVILGIEQAFPYASWRYVPNLCLNTQSFHDDFYDGDPFDAKFEDPFQSFIRSYLPPSGTTITFPNNTMWMDHVNVFSDNFLAALENTWSFTAMKVGDVNCDAITSSGYDEPNLSDTFFGVANNAHTEIAQGQIKTVQIIAEAENNIASWQIGAKFPTSSMHVVSILPGNSTSTFDAENFNLSTELVPQGNSTIKAIWFSQDGTPIDVDGKVLFGFTMQADAPIAALENVIKLSPQTLDIKFYDVLGAEVPVVLKLNVVTSGGIGLQQTAILPRSDKREAPILTQVMVSPNPVENRVNFSFDLNADESVKITIFDSKGQVVARKLVDLSHGSHEIGFPEIAQCPSGLLFYAIKAGDTVQQGKLFKK